METKKVEITMIAAADGYSLINKDGKTMGKKAYLSVHDVVKTGPKSPMKKRRKSGHAWRQKQQRFRDDKRRLSGLFFCRNRDFPT